jgi:hypothetical protein
MAQTSTSNYRLYPKGPNFLLIVVLSTVVILLFLLVAYLVIGDAGTSLLPRVQPKNQEPTSYLVRPGTDRPGGRASRQEAGAKRRPPLPV